MVYMMWNHQMSNKRVLWEGYLSWKSPITLWIQMGVSAIYVIVFCKQSFKPDAPIGILQIRLYEMVDLKHSNIFLQLFLHFCRIYFPEKITYVTLSLALPKEFVKISRGLKVFVSWTCGVTCLNNNTIRGRLSFLQRFCKLLLLIK